MNKNKNYQKNLECEVGAQAAGVSRRRLLKGAAGVAALSTGLGIFATNSLAAKQVGRQGNVTLLRMARDIYPHDKLEDKYYQQVMGPLSDQSSSDDKTLKLITDGLARLETLSADRYGTNYLSIQSETDRVKILQSIESTDFFQKIKGSLMMGIYNNSELWPRFGFGGSSWEKGGYVNDPSYGKVDWF